MDTKGETQDGMNWDIEMDTYATDTMYKIDRASQVVLVNPPPMLVWVRKIPWRRAWQPLEYFCLENSMDRGAWQAIVHRVAESQIQLKRLSTHTCITLVTKENLLYNTENGGDLNGKET